LQPVMLLLQTVEYFQDVVGMFNGITFIPWTYETSPLVYKSQMYINILNHTQHIAL
jgi:hypothetical protein